MKNSVLNVLFIFLIILAFGGVLWGISSTLSEVPLPTTIHCQPDTVLQPDGTCTNQEK